MTKFWDCSILDYKNDEIVIETFKFYEFEKKQWTRKKTFLWINIFNFVDPIKKNKQNKCTEKDCSMPASKSCLHKSPIWEAEVAEDLELTKSRTMEVLKVSIKKVDLKNVSNDHVP